MVKVEIIRKRLNKLDETLLILAELQKYNEEEFLKDPEHYGSAERFLQLAIEAVIDLGNHVVSDENLGIVNSYSDILTILCDKGYINRTLRDKWIKMIGFRNTLVHEYVDINRKIVYAVLQHNLDDIKELRLVFAQFL